MAYPIKSIILQDGTELDATGLAVISLTDSGNVQIVSPDGAKINLEPGDNLAIKAAGKIQLDTNHYVDEADKDEVKIAAICDKKTKVQGIKCEAAGLKFVTADADKTRGWDPEKFKMEFKKTTGAVDTFAKLNLHAASIDLRARSTGKGTGGGIAVQIAGMDSSSKENKFKIETDRTVDVSATAAESDYCGEGGKGIEIGTINSQFTSLYTKSYRFKADAPIYAVTRGALTTDAQTGKVDYPTQADDSKDILNDASPITWAQVVAGIKYLKSKGYIS